MERHFRIKKALVISFCIINVLMWLLYVALANQTWRHWHVKSWQLEGLSCSLLVSVFALGVAFQLTGFIGALRESRPLTTVYLALTLFVAALGLMQGLQTHFRSLHWSGVFWYVLNALATWNFLSSLRRLELERSRLQSCIYDVYPSYEMSKI